MSAPECACCGQPVVDDEGIPVWHDDEDGMPLCAECCAELGPCSLDDGGDAIWWGRTMTVATSEAYL